MGKIVLKHQSSCQIILDLLGVIRGKVKFDARFHWEKLPTPRFNCDLSFFIINTNIVLFPINIVYFIVMICLLFFSLVINIEV